MTALSKNISREHRPAEFVSAGLEKMAVVRQGSLLQIAGDGYVKAAVKGANITYFGVSEEGKTGGAADGDVTVRVRRRGAFYFANSGTAVRGKKAFVLDDNTVTDVSAGASSCGLIIDTDDNGVWVELD